MAISCYQGVSWVSRYFAYGEKPLWLPRPKALSSPIAH
jgi:hypothetical protein